MSEPLEKMDEFFDRRIDDYDRHMLENAEGVAEGYIFAPTLFSPDIKTLLDLGCGSGLELVEFFKVFPHVRVTGIDLSQKMLDALAARFNGRDLELICASYIGRDFGDGAFDAAFSFESLHHMTEDVKLTVYECVFRALKPDGRFVNADYMLESEAEMQQLFAEYAALRDELGLSDDDGSLYHFDTPLTIERELSLLDKTGFANVEKVWRIGATTIVVADKPR